MPSRREGLLSLLIASPMTLLGCTPDPTPADTEGSSSGGPAGSSTGSTGVADSGSTSVGTSTGDGTTSTGSTSATGSSSTSDASTSSGGTTGESTSSSSSGGNESTTTGGGVGNTCERVGDLMNMCFGGGYGYYYESSCNYYINYWIAAGDYACAQAYNEVYSCIADLECAEVFMGVYSACSTEYDNMYDTCYNWGDTFGSDSFGDSGVAFIVPETSGGSATGFFGTDTDFVGSDGGVLLDLPPP